jgi:dihydrofolate reductase
VSKLIVTNHLTLDGVMQAPAGPDEDTRGGFERGGWAAPYGDKVLMDFMTRGMSAGRGTLLFGRRTYEHMFSFWPKQTDGNPFTDKLNRSQKYVASRTLDEPLPWENSTLLKGDVAQEVAELKEQTSSDIVVLGSGDLLQTLMQHDLVDRYVLTINPIVLGSGRRLFNDGGRYAELRLVETKPTTTGVIIAVYEPA